jgi:ABC-type Mn2+/Zn2+ transport system permease subunit
MGDFLASWELFHNAYLAGWSMAVLLAALGVIVVARDQIFAGAALAQASTLGIACALVLGGVGPAWLDSEPFAALLAVAFSAAAALLTSGAAGESRTGWVFLTGASLSTLLLSHSPHGLEEIHRLVASSVIGATALDAGLFAALAAASVAVLALESRRVLLVVIDPAVADALGIRVQRWSLGLALALGVGVGLSIRAAGVLYAFGFLVLPALIARELCREMRSVLLLSPAVALGASVVGFVFADAYDFPPAQVAVAILALALGALWLVRR